LDRRGISPNAITILGCALSVAGAGLIALGFWPAGIALALVGGFGDAVDGLLARQSQRTTPFGAFLDSVLDRWSDSAFFIGLLIYFARADMLTEEVLSGLALSFSLLVSYTRARAEGIGAQCSRGLFTRLERFAVLMAGLILDQMTIALWVIATLSAITAVQRIHHTWRYTQLSLEE
jgi:CDP-diacylglycerol--glycerol-3-phosphate 3-phosphatidyltransferase